MEIGVALSRYKAAGPWSWPLAPMEFQGQEWVELYATSTLPPICRQGLAERIVVLASTPYKLCSYSTSYNLWSWHYLLTPWSTVLLEKLTGSAASQEIPRIFGTRRFITIFTSARHLSLSWANSIQSPQPPPTSWRSILILSSNIKKG